MRILVLLAAAVTAAAQRPEVRIGNSVAEAVFDLDGGSLMSLQFKGELNPLLWMSPGDRDVKLRPMAHFLCLDRWGQPSPAETRSGMPYHGEASRVEWMKESASAAETVLTASLPMAGLDVKRRASFRGSDAVLFVEETVTNRNKLGKVYNMVQHPTIGPPFLDETTIVDSNARRGFMQSSPLPNPEEPSVVWPQALLDGVPVNLRFLKNDPNPNVVSFVVDESMGWVTASSPAKGLLIGYIWRTAEYPWFNAWRHVDNSGKPLARGLEFGTTGLHQPFGVLLEKGQIFGRRLTAYLDTGASTTRSYAAFLLHLPNDWKGVDRVTVANGTITVQERGLRRLTANGGSIF